VQDATRFGNTCRATASTNGPRSETEDGLFVNVWRPSGLKPRRSRPVYAFIHGGGPTNGSTPVAVERLRQEHNCGFWDNLPARPRLRVHPPMAGTGTARATLIFRC
jgi:hypothetical protein